MANCKAALSPVHQQWRYCSFALSHQCYPCCPCIAESMAGADQSKLEMETFSMLLALCEWNLLVTGGFSSQRPVMWSFDVFLIWAYTNGWANNWHAGDLRCHCTHYDVTIMYCRTLTMKLDSSTSNMIMYCVILPIPGWFASEYCLHFHFTQLVLAASC